MDEQQAFELGETMSELGSRLVRAERRISLEAGTRAGRSLAWGRSRASVTKIRIALTSATALVAVLMVFTAPGRSLASDIADLVGIGDDPTVPQHAANQLDSVVIGTGSTSKGAEFQIVASRLEAGVDDDVCISVDLPDTVTPGQGPCLTSSSRPTINDGHVPPGYVVAAERPFAPADQLIVGGLVPANTRDVSVTYKDGAHRSQAPVTYVELTPELAEAIGSRDAFGAYFAFIPDIFGGSSTAGNVLDGSDALAALAAIHASVEAEDGSHQAVSFDSEADLNALRMSPPTGYEKVSGR